MFIHIHERFVDQTQQGIDSVRFTYHGFCTFDCPTARKDRQEAASEFVALEQIGRERRLDLSEYFPGVRLEETLKNVERRNRLVLGELLRWSKGRLQRGLDLAGGVAITLEIDAKDTAPADPLQQQESIAKAIEIIGKELDVSMALTGTRNVRDIDRRVLVDGERNALAF